MGFGFTGLVINRISYKLNIFKSKSVLMSCGRAKFYTNFVYDIRRVKIDCTKK